MLDSCTPHHDWFNAVLTGGLCIGMVISYLPQHIRIIQAKSSEGISALFLFLGVLSTSSSMFNMVTLQAPIIKCCRVVSLGSCLEMSAGVIQMTLQSICFAAILILYMVYYPEHLKYTVQPHGEIELLSPNHKKPVKSDNWKMSIILAWSAAAHFVFAAATTAFLLSKFSDLSSGGQAPQIVKWATFLGVSSATIATIQYTPQLIHTFRLKLVGALSIPMMMIQTPGGILMVASVALRPGTDWTSWITFLVSAALQGVLLFMCIMWKIRQRKLHIDDFGNPLEPSGDEETAEVYDPQPFVLDEPSSAPELVIASSSDPVVAREDTMRSVDDGVQGDADEETPLLKRRERPQGEVERGWSAWFGR